MAFVDLRDRQDEPAVRALIELGTGSRASAERARTRYADRSWALVGWSAADELVGCVGVERASDDEIVLHTVAVAEPFRSNAGRQGGAERHLHVRGGELERHAWNRLPSGVELDLTREQFRGGELLEQPVVGEPLLTQQDPERFTLLRARVRKSLDLQAEPR